MRETLSYGLVGAGPGSFIGGVHKTGADFDGRAVLAAGCFSTREEANKEAGRFYRIKENSIDFVTITAPNCVHYQAARAFLENGIHVMCEKPLCFEVKETEELKALAESRGLLFAVNYSYSGYNMVKEARELIRNGHIGEIINVNAEYFQEWLIDDIGAGDGIMNKLSVWRKNPAKAGMSNCVGDIGTHIEHTISYMTGLKVRRVADILKVYMWPLPIFTKYGLPTS